MTDKSSSSLWTVHSQQRATCNTYMYVEPPWMVSNSHFLIKDTYLISQNAVYYKQSNINASEHLWVYVKFILDMGSSSHWGLVKAPII